MMNRQWWALVAAVRGWWIDGRGVSLRNMSEWWEFELRKWGMTEIGLRKKEIKKKYIYIYIYIYILMWGGNKNLFLSLALSYSVHSYIAMHYSCVGKTFTYTTTNVTPFFVYGGAKISFLAPPILMLVALFYSNIWRKQWWNTFKWALVEWELRKKLYF